MSRAEKLLKAALANPAGLSFTELQRLAEAAGFALARIKGDHHVYTRPGTIEIVNLQPAKGNQAKAYQVRQVLDLIEKYTIAIV